MLKLTVTLSLTILCFIANAQVTDTTKVEQYCEIVATGKLFSRKVTIQIDFGDKTKFFQDTRIKDEEGKVEKFETLMDALNYAGKKGWKLVNAFPVSEGNGPMVYHYVFKKEFPRADVIAADADASN